MTSNPSFQRQVIKVVCLYCELVILVRHTCSRLRQKIRLYNTPSLCGGGMISIKQLRYCRSAQQTGRAGWLPSRTWRRSLPSVIQTFVMPTSWANKICYNRTKCQILFIYVNNQSSYKWKILCLYINLVSTPPRIKSIKRFNLSCPTNWPNSMSPRQWPKLLSLGILDCVLQK